MPFLELLSIPEDGMEYPSLDRSRLALDDWAVKANLILPTLRRDATRAVYICVEAEDLSCALRYRARPDLLRWTEVEGTRVEYGNMGGKGGRYGERWEEMKGEEDVAGVEEGEWDAAVRLAAELAAFCTAEAAARGGGGDAAAAGGGGGGGEEDARLLDALYTGGGPYLC